MNAVTRLFLLLICLITTHALGAGPVRPVVIGIFAQDYSRTVSWYSRNFEFETSKEVVREPANFRIGFLSNGEFELEIYADIVPDGDAARLPRERFGMPREGFVKLSVETDNLEAMADRLKSNGAEFVREINQSDRKPGQSWFMVSDPDGNLVQVFGPTPEAP